MSSKQAKGSSHFSSESSSSRSPAISQAKVAASHQKPAAAGSAKRAAPSPAKRTAPSSSAAGQAKGTASPVPNKPKPVSSSLSHTKQVKSASSPLSVHGKGASVGKHEAPVAKTDAPSVSASAAASSSSCSSITLAVASSSGVSAISAAASTSISSAASSSASVNSAVLSVKSKIERTSLINDNSTPRFKFDIVGLGVNQTLIDEQHRQLFELLSAFYEAGQVDDQNRKEHVDGLFPVLAQHTIDHFTSEEAVFSPWLPALRVTKHKEIHAAFLKKVTEVRESWNATNTKEDRDALFKTIVEFVFNWLFDHITTVDQPDIHDAQIAQANQSAVA